MCKPKFDIITYHYSKLMRELGFSEKEREAYIKSCYSLLGTFLGSQDCLEKTLEKAKGLRLGKIETKELLNNSFEEMGRGMIDILMEFPVYKENKPITSSQL